MTVVHRTRSDSWLLCHKPINSPCSLSNHANGRVGRRPPQQPVLNSASGTAAHVVLSHRLAWLSPCSLIDVGLHLLSARSQCDRRALRWLPVWLSGNALVSINAVTLGAWVTVVGQTVPPAQNQARWHPRLLSLNHPYVGRLNQYPTKAGEVNRHIT